MKIKVRNIPVLSAGIIGMTFKNYAMMPFIKKEYPRNYLTEPRVEGRSLREAALRKGIWIGAAVEDSETPAFDQALSESFTSVTPSNALKWGELRKKLSLPYDFTRADRIVNAALSKGARVRGHALVWGKFPGSGFPMDLAEILNQASNPKADLQKILEDHIVTVAGRYVGRISAWDVVNEPFELFRNRVDKNVFYQVLGLDYIPMSFALARQACPTSMLFLNEHLSSYVDDRAEALLKLVRDLREKNMPLDGVGLQSHVCIELPSMQELGNYLKQLAGLGLEIEITEMDASLSLFRRAKDPYRAQGDFFKAFTETCLECPACKGITFWGINDKNNWMDHLLPPLIPFKPNNPLLYDDEMCPKPAHAGVLSALT
jgi:endo-1,4-beta-xylanase